MTNDKKSTKPATTSGPSAGDCELVAMSIDACDREPNPEHAAANDRLVRALRSPRGFDAAEYAAASAILLGSDVTGAFEMDLAAAKNDRADALKMLTDAASSLEDFAPAGDNAPAIGAAEYEAALVAVFKLVQAVGHIGEGLEANPGSKAMARRRFESAAEDLRLVAVDLGFGDGARRR